MLLVAPTPSSVFSQKHLRCLTGGIETSCVMTTGNDPPTTYRMLKNGILE